MFANVFNILKNSASIQHDTHPMPEIYCEILLNIVNCYVQVSHCSSDIFPRPALPWHHQSIVVPASINADVYSTRGIYVMLWCIITS